MFDKLDRLLQLFSVERPEWSGPEIGRALGLPKTTTYRILRRLTTAGFVDVDESTSRYRLGIRLAVLGELACHSTSVQRAALPGLRQLSESTGEWVTLMVLAGTEAMVVEVVQSYRPLALPGLLGGHRPLHATAGGKALVAWKSRDQWRHHLKPPLKRYTTATITDFTALERELGLVRKHGYAVSKGEWFDDMIGVGAPIRDHRHTVVAALTIGCPYPRTNSSAKIAALATAVQSTADQVSRTLGYATE